MAIAVAVSIFIARGAMIGAGLLRVEGPGAGAAAAGPASWAALTDSLAKVIDAMYNAARSMAGIGVTCACAGMVVGMVSLTGAGLNMTNILVEFSFGNVYLAMMLTMVACLILGMGVPTTPNYVIMATIMAPALIAMKPDTPLIAAHLFVFYFGILADGTPPVCLAAYAAAGIAGADPFKTGLESFKLDMRTFLLPYMFITAPQMLLIGLDPGIMGVAGSDLDLHHRIARHVRARGRHAGVLRRRRHLVRTDPAPGGRLRSGEARDHQRHPGDGRLRAACTSCGGGA